MRIAAGLLFAVLCVASSAFASAKAAPSSVSAPANPPDSPLHLFASLEEAWLASDAEQLASLVDTTSVRIGLKPGVPPATAVTRSAAAFLFQDQLRLVKTQGFHVVRLEVSKKGPAKAVASWDADWGGRQGVRTLEVKLTAVPSAGRWLLTEVRADD